MATRESYINCKSNLRGTIQMIVLQSVENLLKDKLKEEMLF